MDLIVSFPDDIEVSSGQLKRFNEPVIHQKCLLKVEATYFCLDNNLSFSGNIVLSCILLFLFEKYSLHAFQNGWVLQSTLSLPKCCNLACLFRFATRFCCRLNPAGNCMFKVNNRNTRTRCEICSKLTIKTPERR